MSERNGACFVTPEFSGNTGGSIGDRDFFRRISNWQGNRKTQLMDYAYFGEEYASVKKDFLRWNLVFRKNAGEMMNCDYLFINCTISRLFRIFPWRRRKKSDCVTVGIIHHPDYLNRTGQKKRIEKRMLRAFLKNMDYVITPNPFTLDWLKNEGFSDRSVLCEMDLSREIHRREGPGEKIVCFVGTVEPRKGLEYGIRAFAGFLKHHPDYQFQIAGAFREGFSDPAYCDELETLISELGAEGKVRFLGRVDEKEKESLYSRSDIFLFPSQLEGYGWVLIEAMSHGLPVVAFDNSAIPYTVKAGNGFVVPNRDVDAMADALDRLAEDETLYRHLSDGAVRTVEKLPGTAEVDMEWKDFFRMLEREKAGC